MRLLVITQAVDERDTVLGFFTHWIEEFSQRFESVEVICLRKGTCNLPDNVRVHSLEKEKGSSRIRRIFLFFYFSIFYSSKYDAVFVHMNQEYILLGGLFWKIMGKPIFFWRNHRHGTFLTRLAVAWSNRVFCTSTDSFTARFSKTLIMPAGIDVALFEKSVGVERKKNSLLVFGRIAPVKRIEHIIDACALLKERGYDFSLSIVGDVLSKDESYLAVLKDRADTSKIAITFSPGVPFNSAPRIYQSHDLFLNFTPSGSFDKTIIEALASGTKVLVANDSMKGLLPEGSWTDGTPEDAAQKIESLLNMDHTQLNYYHGRAREVVNNQSLPLLIDTLTQVIGEKNVLSK